MFNYAQSADTALRLITNFGASYAIKRITNVIAQPELLKPTPTVANGTIKAVVLPAKASNLNLVEGDGDERLRDGLIKGKVRFVLAAAKGATFAPTVADEITIETKQFEIIACTPLNPAGIPIVYKIGAILK